MTHSTSGYAFGKSTFLRARSIRGGHILSNVLPKRFRTKVQIAGQNSSVPACNMEAVNMDTVVTYASTSAKETPHFMPVKGKYQTGKNAGNDL